MKKISSLLSSSSKSAMAHSMEGKKEVYYTIVEQFESGLNDKKGCCFLMNFQPDITKFRARQRGQLMWVTSGNIFDTQNQTQKKKFFVKGMKNKSSFYEFVQTQVRTSLTGEVAFINCDYPDEKARKDLHCLTFGYLEKRPDEVLAYVYDGKKVKELKFVKTDGAGTYKLDKHAGKTEFNMRKAIGAPVITDKGRIQVVGLLDRNKDGTLYPVFFDLETFKTGQVGASLPSITDFSQDIEGLPSDRDEKDSPLTHGLTGIPSCRDEKDSPTLPHGLTGIPSCRDEKDSPTLPHGLTGPPSDRDEKDNQTLTLGLTGLPSSRDARDSPALRHGITDRMTQINLNGDNGAGSSVQVEDDKGGSAGPFQKQVTTEKSKAESYGTDQPVPKCIKHMQIEEAPQTHSLRHNLTILLDPPAPRGNDYRALADSFKPNYKWIKFLKTKDSPTETILLDKGFCCTIWELREKLENMERADAVEEVDEYIKNQDCKCEDCSR